MMLVDANLLLYARLSSFAQHDRARTWLDEQLNGPAPVGLAWPSLLAFVRISINPRVFAQPLAATVAWKQVEEWLACRPVWTPVPAEAHARVLSRFMADPSITPNLVGDAHLAALAVEHGLMLCSADGDFARFEGLRWMNPLVA